MDRRMMLEQDVLREHRCSQGWEASSEDRAEARNREAIQEDIRASELEDVYQAEIPAMARRMRFEQDVLREHRQGREESIEYRAEARNREAIEEDTRAEEVHQAEIPAIFRQDWKSGGEDSGFERYMEAIDRADEVHQAETLAQTKRTRAQDDLERREEIEKQRERYIRFQAEWQAKILAKTKRAEEALARELEKVHQAEISAMDRPSKRPDADIDYVLAYENVKSFGSESVEFKFDNPPKVVTIYRMYVSLNTLDVPKEKDLSVVEELIVVADVVAIDSSQPITLPGTHRVVILCRVIEFKHKPTAVKDPRELRTNIRTSLKQSEGSRALELEWLKDAWRFPHAQFTAPESESGKPTQLFVFAQGERGTTVFEGQTLHTETSAFTLEQAPVRIGWVSSLQRRSVRDSPKTAATSGWSMRVEPTRSGTQNAFGVEASFLHPEPSYMRTNQPSLDPIEDEPVKQVPGPSVGFVVCAEFSVPGHLLEIPHVVTGLQALLLVTEGILLYGQDEARQESKHAVAAAALHCQWLTTFVLKNRDQVKTGDDGGKALRNELNLLYVRAKGLGTYYADGPPKVLIPPLNYKLYRDLIERVADTARLYDEDLKATSRQLQTVALVTSTSQGVNTNFVKLYKVLAAKEKDVEDMKGRVMDLQNVELQEAQSNLKKLSKKLIAQQEAMEKSKKAMNEEVEKYKADEKAKAAWAVLGAICAVAVAIGTGGATAGAAFASLKSLAEAGKELKKVLDVFEKLVELLKALKELTDLLEKGTGGVEIKSIPNSPSMSEWDEFEIEVERVAEKLPEKISGGKDWKAECKKVAAVGREISIVAFNASKLEYKLKLAGWEKDIASRHRERLLDNTTIEPLKLSHEKMEINLELKRLQMINSLLEMLNIQNSALHYHYLQQPKVIVALELTIYNIQELLIHNDRNAVAFNEILGKSSELEREYVFKDIPVLSLLSGEDVLCTIAKDDSNFPKSWQRVRIKHLTMKFTNLLNQPTTETGEIYLVLSGDHVFFDRYDGKFIEFEATRALQYPYAYNLETNKCTLQNSEIPSKLGNFMRMTPFSRWKLRVSKDAYENKNLHFNDESEDGVTDITITFYMTLIRKIE